MLRSEPWVSKSGSTYTLSFYDNGDETCTCPGFKFQKFKVLHDSSVKKEDKWCKHLTAYHQQTPVAARVAQVAVGKPKGKRFTRAFATTVLMKVERILDGMAKCWICAGSYRRHRDDIGDLDIIIVCSKKQWRNLYKMMTVFSTTEIVSGDQKMSFMVEGMQVELSRIPEESWGNALCHYTGSTTENIRLRGIAKSKGMKLNQFFLEDAAGNQLAFDTEKAVYKALGIPYVPPEQRG